jgi:hypothetical protein
LVDGKRAVWDVRRPPVPLEIHFNDFVALGQCWKCSQSAKSQCGMNKNERLS